MPSVNVIEEFVGDHIAYKISFDGDVNVSNFTLEELEVLQKVAIFFRNFKTKEIVDYMHDEIAYIDTKLDDIIPYSLLKQIRKFN